MGRQEMTEATITLFPPADHKTPLLRFREFVLRLLLVICTGTIFVVFSELMFWGRYDFKHKMVSDFVPTITVYSLLAYALLMMVRLFRVRSWYALFIAGAVFGWLCEGGFVQTMYNDFPMNISFTGLAWHSLLTVCCGWYLFRRLLLCSSLMPIVKASAIGGMLWALWSVWWWVTKGLISPPAEFALYALITALLLIVSLRISAMIPSSVFQPTKAEIYSIIILFLIYYVFVTIKANPMALTVLPICLSLAFWALAVNRKHESAPDLLTQLDGELRPLNYVALLLMPVASILVYTMLYYMHLRLKTGPVFYFILTPAGFWLFIYSFVRLLRRDGSPHAKAQRREGLWE